MLECLSVVKPQEACYNTINLTPTDVRVATCDRDHSEMLMPTEIWLAVEVRQRACQIECQNRCQVECQKESQCICQIACQKKCQRDMPERMSAGMSEYTYKYSYIYIYIYVYVYLPDGMSEAMSEYVSGWGPLTRSNFKFLVVYDHRWSKEDT